MTQAHASTPLGDYAGLNRDGVAVFKGIQYAVADRFRPSELDSSTWSGLRDATVYGPQCLQVPGTMELLLGESTQPMDEDCLTLNVFSSDVNARNPVLVWIHGGAFTNGAGSIPWYDGCNLVRSGNLVVVTINYRLGAFGYRGSDNAGMSDQVNALRWVQNNIESFGGDPTQVTIMGESAGGASVISMMACPQADGLYSGAIAMSPSIPQMRSRERGDETLSELLAAAGVTHPDDLISMPAADLLNAQASVLTTTSDSLSAFAPTTDDNWLPGDPSELAAANPVPLMIGTTRDEMHLFTAFDPAVNQLDESQARHAFSRHFGNDEGYDVYRTHRPGHSPAQLVSALRTDAVFRRPAHRIADGRHHHGLSTYAYWFTFETPVFGGVLGSCHALDIPFALNNLDRKGVELFTGDAPERNALAHSFSGAVTLFSKTRNAGWAEWGAERNLQLLNTDTAVGDDIIRDSESDIRELWESAHDD